MKKNLKFLSGVLMTFLLAVGVFAGCGNKVSIEIMSNDNIYEVKPGDSVTFDANVKNAKKEDVVFSVVSGAGVFEGKVLKVNTDAEVGSVIKVVGSVGGGTSKEVSLAVVDLVPSSIKINFADGRQQAKIAKTENSKITLGVSYNPSYATVKDYTFEITEGIEIVSRNGNEFALTDKANVGDKFKVKATLNGHTDISDEIEIEVVDALKIEKAIANNINYFVKTMGEQYIEVKAYNGADGLVPTTNTDFEYTSKNTDVATVNSQGKITAVGHGVAEIEIRKAGESEVITTCKVYVMITPESLNLEKVSTLIHDKSEMSYGKSEKLNLNIKATNSSYATCATKLKYEFNLLDINNQITKSGDEVAVLTEQGIEFKQNGKVEVVVTSDSSLNRYRTKDEKSISLIVNVNDGVNIRKASELKTAAESGRHTVYNILSDICLTENDNFNIGSDYNTAGVQGCVFYGETIINGNGYKVDSSTLPQSVADGNAHLLDFRAKREGSGNADVIYSVKLYDLEVRGGGNVGVIADQKIYYNNDKKDLMELDDKNYFKHTYHRGIVVNYGSDYNRIATEGKKICKDLVMSNVSVSGFSVGMRISHAVDALITDCKVEQCFNNGIESDQNMITFHNITLGQVGAFGVEITPDDMANKENDNIRGTAGLNYDQTATVNYTGYINSTNYNNGASTMYMYGIGQSLKGAGYSSIGDVIAAIVGGTAQAITSDSTAQAKLKDVAYNCLSRSHKEGGDINYFQLIFVDTSEVKTWKKANQIYDQTGNRKFVNYPVSSNMINMQDLLVTYATKYSTDGSDWQGYKQYQYIILDLMSMGQAILVNQAYDPNYTPSK